MKTLATEMLQNTVRFFKGKKILCEKTAKNSTNTRF